MLKNKRAAILITALWIVAILAVFAVSVGRQSAISLKITSYNTDRLKAYFAAGAAIQRALAEKALEYKSGRSATIDALSQSWANNKELFDNHRFGAGSYTLCYEYPERETAGEAQPRLYGLMDEQSKININYAPIQTMANLIASFDIDTDEAEEIAAAIADWRDEDGDVTSVEVSNLQGAESSYYEELSVPYYCKNLPFENIYELPLVRGITPDIFRMIKDYITVYGDGRVNINTAGERVLNALFGPAFSNLASKIVGYREGGDDIIGTEDDRWFSQGPYIVERGEEGLVEIKDLQDADWYANIYGVTTEEYNRVRELIVGGSPQLCVNSRTYRAVALGNVRKVEVKIEAVYSFEEQDRPPAVKFWYQD